MVYVNGNVYGTAPITQSKQESKVEAYTNALAYARKIHYTIKVRSPTLLRCPSLRNTDNKIAVPFQQKEIVDTVEVACEEKLGANAPTDGDTSKKICSDNKGFKMMKMLGWTGGALGTSGDGIKEPVRFVPSVRS